MAKQLFPRYHTPMPHSRNRAWIDIQKKLAGFHHPEMRTQHDAAWIPNADVIEHGDGLLIRVELAGIAIRSLQITIANAALVITGSRINPQTGGTAAGYKFRQMEIEYGPFERVLPLPYPIDRKNAQARNRNGLLEVVLPRATRQTRQKTVIEIKW